MRKRWSPYVAAATAETHLRISKRVSYKAFSGVVPHECLLKVLLALQWSPEDHFALILSG